MDCVDTDDIWVDPTTRTLVIGGSSTANDTGVFVKAPSDAEWTHLTDPSFAAVRAVSGTSMTDLYAATDSDVYRYDGSQWSHVADSHGCPGI